LHLADRLYGRHRGVQVVGFGLSIVDANSNRFRDQSGLREPYILYSGRLEGAKNLPMLLHFFIDYKQRHRSDLKLVLMGQGPETIPNHRDIIHLGFKKGQEKLDVYAAASALCQPSINESFSIVIMESWLTGVPVLVNASCEVTRYHVSQSNGGLYFRDYDEFEALIDLLTSQESLRRRLGEQGKRYVQKNYNWDIMLDRFANSLEYWNSLK
jgi:glycosyltransferase involved in cell wall biosynthesis